MTHKVLFIIMNLMIFLRPHFGFANPVIATYLGDVIIVGIIIIFTPFVKMKMCKKDYELLYLSGFLMLGMLLPVVTNALKSNVGYGIWLDYGKIIYYIIVFWFLYFLLKNIVDKAELYNKIIDVIFFIILVISLIQLINPPLITKFIHGLYGATKLRSIWGGYPRIYGTFYNANWFGIYLVFYLSWLNSNFIFKKIGFKKFIIRLLLVSSLFILSGSRTAMVGAVITLFFQFFNFKKIRSIITLAISSTVLFFLVGKIAMKIELLNKTLLRFTSVFSIFKTGGLSMADLNPGRWVSWGLTYQKFTENILFGSGYIGEVVPHNSYLYFLNMFGIIGALIMFIFLIAFKMVSKDSNSKNNIVITWRKGFIPSFLIMSLTAEFLFTTQVMLLLILILVISLVCKETDVYNIKIIFKEMLNV